MRTTRVWQLCAAGLSGLLAITVLQPTPRPGGTAPVIRGPGQVPVSAPTTAPTTAERAALVQARESGRPVEVVAKRTEAMEVFAEPDGPFTARISPRPVRVRRGGGWVPVDTTVARQPDGSVAPAATIASLRFSGGGRAPLVRLGRDGREVALAWPGRLPAPVLAGGSHDTPLSIYERYFNYFYNQIR